MILSYNVKQTGTYHIQEGLPCQDAFAVTHGDGFSVAAVADGLSTAWVNGQLTTDTHTDIGSSIAVNTAVKHCKDGFSPDMDRSAIHQLLKASFRAAWDAVLAEAEKNGHDAALYETTLCLSILTVDGKAYFGNAGDSGAVALLENGQYLAVCPKGEDENGGVFPLSCEETWFFGAAKKPVSAVLLASDGIYDQLVPSILSQEDTKVYVALADLFMNRDEEGDQRVKMEEDARSYVAGHFTHVHDDMTMVCLYNTQRPAARREPEYYAPPDWGAMHAKAMAAFEAMMEQSRLEPLVEEPPMTEPLPQNNTPAEEPLLPEQETIRPPIDLPEPLLIAADVLDEAVAEVMECGSTFAYSLKEFIQKLLEP